MKSFNIPSLVPEFQVKNFNKSVAFYQGILGFNIEYSRHESKFAMISLERAWIMLEETKDFHAVSDREFIEERQWRTGELESPFGRGINFQILVCDVDKLYAKIIKSKYPIKVPIEERWYRAENKETGVRQFLIMDPDGYLLRLQQEIGERLSSNFP